MSEDNFSQRKESILSKKDKSSKGKWDEKISGLCGKINEKEEYYTTSSCSGRVIVMVDREKKESGLFKFVSHGLVSLEELKKGLGGLGGTLKFKQVPCIIHVACKTLGDAKELLDKGREVGWKNSGVISLGDNIIVELSGTEKLEFPIVREGKILVSEEFLKVVVEKSNENLKKNWKRIEKLGKLL